MRIYCIVNGIASYIFIIQYIYISVYALFGHISHNKSSVHGHESFKTYKKTLDEIFIMSHTEMSYAFSFYLK
jgi:hypothetical protein